MGVQEANLCKISKWDELQNSVVVLRGIGRTDFCSGAVLVLQPVGCLIPYDLEHDVLLDLFVQFSRIVMQFSERGYLHGDLSYYNLLVHQDSEDQDRHGQAVRALLVDMQTLMPLAEVPFTLLHILLQCSFSCPFVSCASRQCCYAGRSCRIHNWYTAVHGIECPSQEWS